MIIDTHAHYDDEAFDKDREKLLDSMQNRGIEYIVNVGASIAKQQLVLQEDSLMYMGRLEFILTKLQVLQMRILTG